MKPNDRKTFFVEFGALAEVMNETVTEVKAKIYFEDLCDFPIEVIIKALRTARKELRWFPKIKDLRELCHEIYSSMARERIPEDHRLPETIEIPEEERKASEERIRAIIEECKEKFGISSRRAEKEDRALEFERKREALRKQAESLVN